MAVTLASKEGRALNPCNPGPAWDALVRRIDGMSLAYLACPDWEPVLVNAPPVRRLQIPRPTILTIGQSGEIASAPVAIETCEFVLDVYTDRWSTCITHGTQSHLQRIVDDRRMRVIK